MRRGEVWTASRFGHDRKVLIVGNESVARDREGILVVPISDVLPPGLVEPVVRDVNGAVLGVAQTPRVGQVNKETLKARAGALAPASVEIVDISLRTVLDL
ncbi:hypothetical protein [Actinoplanes sp. NPDC049802]|uniref:hypothetical protein n=1 Tax=Actinoplanes sp. NPDC049802 TaxID=3154742 RepID=UPI00340BAE02